MNKTISAPKEDEIKIEAVDIDTDMEVKILPTKKMDIETVEILIDDRISTGG